MRKCLVSFILIMLLLTSVGYAEITKEFDQFEGKITIESTKEVALNEYTNLKVIMSKSFFSNDGFKDTRVTLMIVQLIPQKVNLGLELNRGLYWLQEGEPFGHEEKWRSRLPSTTQSIIVSQEMKSAIKSGKNLFIKLPTLNKDIYFEVTPETLSEWNEVITFDAIKNPPDAHNNQIPNQ